ncbi:hypothetical protein BX666DRAFT_1582563 [Dichotomocladium elegans]|nr:hypothetical protein BX666DRAFT_1582563 [Dichotomocladium elegans]
MMEARRSDELTMDVLEKQEPQPAAMQEVTNKLNAMVFIDEENRTHPSVQLASTALRNGYTSGAECSDVVPPTSSTLGNAGSIGQVEGVTGPNVILIRPVDPKDVQANTLDPREQEREGG